MAELTPDATKAMNMRANGERPWSFHDSFDVCRNDRLLLLQHSDALSARLAEADALIAKGLAVVHDFLPNIGRCVLQDYQRMNEFCSEAAKRAADSASVCSTCNGSGEARGRTYHLGPDDHEIDVECPACFGLGEIKLSPGFKPRERTCHFCNGSGKASSASGEQA